MRTDVLAHVPDRPRGDLHRRPRALPLDTARDLGTPHTSGDHPGLGLVCSLVLYSVVGGIIVVVNCLVLFSVSRGFGSFLCVLFSIPDCRHDRVVPVCGAAHTSRDRAAPEVVRHRHGALRECDQDRRYIASLVVRENAIVGCCCCSYNMLILFSPFSFLSLVHVSTGATNLTVGAIAKMGSSVRRGVSSLSPMQ